MKLRHVLGLILVFLFLLSIKVFVSYARVNNPMSIYSAFFYDLSTKKPEAFANYRSQGAAYIFDVTEDSDSWYIGTGKFSGTSYYSNSSSNNWAKSKNSTSYPYIKYICVWSKTGFHPTCLNKNSSRTFSSNTTPNFESTTDKIVTFWDKGNAPSSERSYYFVAIMNNEDKIVYLDNVYPTTFEIGGTTQLISAGQTVYGEQIVSGNDYVYQVYKEQTDTNISTMDFDFSGNFENYELYEYLLNYLTYHYNYYINEWANSICPTCCIFDNKRGNVKFNKLNNNFMQPTVGVDDIGSDYVVVFYGDRLCHYYDSSANSHYFNFLSYSQPFYYVVISKGGGQSISFNVMNNAYNNTTPAVQVQYDYPETLVFSNKNIIEKSNANDFVMNGNNFTYWRTFSYELKTIPSFPTLSPESPGYSGIDTSVIEENQISMIDTVTSFFSGFFDNIKNALLSVFDFVGETILALWNTIKNQILSKLPIFWITDVISWIQDIYQNAIVRSQNLDFIYHLNVLGADIEFDPLFLYKSNKIYLDKFLNLGLIIGLVFFNIKHIFVVLKGGKQS